MTATSRVRDGMALAALCLAGLMFGLEISSVPVILPTVGSVLRGDFAELQWIMNAYTIACVAVLMATGVLADRFGRRRVFAVSVVAFGLTSLLCGLAPNIGVLVLGRALQGLSGGAMLICDIAILSYQFREGRDRARAFGIWGLFFGFGLGFGPVVGAGLVAISNWRWVLLVHLFVAALTLALLVPGVRESRDPEAGRLDLRGMATLSLAVLGLAFYITEGPNLGFTAVVELVILGLTGALLVGFVIVETTARRPMFQFALFRIRTFSGALLGCVGMNVSFWPLIIYLPIYLQHGLGYSVSSAAVILLGFTLPTLVLPPVAERLLLSYRAAVVIPLGLYVIGAGFLLLRLGSAAGNANWLTILPGLLVSGVGLGLTSTPVTNTTTGSVPGNRSGMASGIDMSARLVTLAVNISVMGILLSVGIARSLRERLSGHLPPQQVHDVAAHVANGDSPATLRAAFPQLGQLDPSGSLVSSALTRGFGLITLYGCVAVWLLATASLMVFRVSPRSRVPSELARVSP
jgi:EmrB/QacA subfamily drug resistance transporter